MSQPIRFNTNSNRESLIQLLGTAGFLVATFGFLDDMSFSFSLIPTIGLVTFCMSILLTLWIKDHIQICPKNREVQFINGNILNSQIVNRVPRNEIIGVEVFLSKGNQNSRSGYKIQLIALDKEPHTLQNYKSSLSKALTRANEVGKLLEVPVAFNKAPTIQIGEGKNPLAGILEEAQIYQMIHEGKNREFKGILRSTFLLIIVISIVSTFLWYHNLSPSKILYKLKAAA